MIDSLLAAGIIYTIRVTETNLNQSLDIWQEKQDFFKKKSLFVTVPLNIIEAQY